MGLPFSIKFLRIAGVFPTVLFDISKLSTSIPLPP